MIILSIVILYFFRSFFIFHLILRYLMQIKTRQVNKLKKNQQHKFISSDIPVPIRKVQQIQTKQTLFIKYYQMTVKLQPNFKIKDYLGKWFQIHRTSNIRFEKGSNIMAHYQFISQQKIRVTNYQYFDDKKKWDSIVGDAIVFDPSQPAHVGVKFFFLMPRANYKIIYTDYTEIAIVFSDVSLCCGLYTSESAWILSRNKKISKETEEKAFKILQQQTGLKRDSFIKTVQEEGLTP